MISQVQQETLAHNNSRNHEKILALRDFRVQVFVSTEAKHQ